MLDQTTNVIVTEDSHGKITKPVPIMYKSNGTSQSTCGVNGMEYTNGQILFGGSIYTLQESCKPNSGNAGNYYSWPASTAGGSISDGNENNSICPTGWQLTVNAGTKVKSWYYLIRNTYSIKDSNDSKLLPLPMSFIRSGNYNQGSLSNRASSGFYWSSTASNNTIAYYLAFRSASLHPQFKDDYRKNNGLSVRCVSR